MNIFKLVLNIAIIIVLQTQYLLADETNSDEIEYHIFTFGGGLAVGGHRMSNDMYDLTKIEVDRINANRKEGADEKITPEGFYTVSTDLYADFFISDWMNISFFGEALYGTSNGGIDDTKDEQELSSDYDLKKFTAGIMPGLIFRSHYFSIILNAGVTYSNIHFINYEVNAAGYRIKLTGKPEDFIVPGIKLFMLFDRAYGKDRGVEIGSTGIQFGVEYNFYRI